MEMRKILFVLFLTFCSMPFGFAQEGALPSSAEVIDIGNTICPISGRKANPKATAVYQGKKYAFCCQDCVKKFKENPEKYLAQTAEKG